MLRGSLLAAALVPLLGFGSGTGQVRNGRIAFEHIGESGGAQIYSMTSRGTERRLLTPGRGRSSRSPAFSPNGHRIVFVRAFKQRDLWLMRSDGSHKRRLTSTTGADEVSPAWSPDGQAIVFAVGSPTAQKGIWVIGTDGGRRRQLTSGADGSPSWSPDGSEIAFDR